MAKFQMNQDMTYDASSLVENNVFLKMPAENEALPQYGQIAQLLPKPIWRGHDDVIACYDFAWRTAFGNLKQANGSSHFVSNYIDTAFNGCLFMWDSSFIVMFGKYAARAFNFQKTLDNFYAHQHKDGFYYDLWKDGQLSRVKTIGAYWALLADIIPRERLGRFVAHLESEKEFKRPCRIPTLSADHPAYEDNGRYWRGGVWAPTNYMVLKGLKKNGFDALAHDIARNCLENVVEVFRKDGTIYENYAPEYAGKGNPAKADFVGWSACFPSAFCWRMCWASAR